MGSFSPVRIQTDSPKPTAGPPFDLVPNQYSLLDKTDLVFIDAPLTGYSRAVGKGTAKDLTGVDNDLRAFDRFIIRYFTVNQRWNSPKFLIGESYGTTRSAALADMLGNDGIQFNGVVLISSILNYSIRTPGYDTVYIGNLPSYAAAAWYSTRCPTSPPTFPPGCSRRASLPPATMRTRCLRATTSRREELDSVAKQVSHFTGLSVDYVKEANLRISPTRFRKEMLRDDRMTLGRYDMRFEGEDVDAAGENPSYDPSDTGITGAFVARHSTTILKRELKYQSTDTYRPTAYGIGPVGLQASAHQRRSDSAAPAASSRSPTWPLTWPAPCARTRTSRSSPPTATSTSPRRSSSPSSTWTTCSCPRNCARTSSSATIRQAT